VSGAVVRAFVALSMLACAWRASAGEHVAPDPPQHVVGEMDYRAMAQMMEMDDAENIGLVALNRLEWREQNDAAWEARAWYGDDYDKALLKSEGEHEGGFSSARNELLWDRIVSRWWSAQTGLRSDTGSGPTRHWLAFGVEGLAPYWFDVEAAIYAGEAGRTALRVKVEYELLFTQRLILQPEVEANVYGKTDIERQLGSGLSDASVGLRLRYELRREFAAYVGIERRRTFAGTADFARAAGEPVLQTQAVAGLRVWF